LKSNFNTLVKTTHLIEWNFYFEYLREIKYDTLNYDALWKWAGILDSVCKLYGEHPKFETCIDIGGGLSPIHLILSNYGNIKNIDDYSHSNGKLGSWFPVKGGKSPDLNIKENVFYVESPGFHYVKENIEYINSDIIEYLQSIPDNSIDLYVDGCSLIHVGPCSNYSFHDGISDVMGHVHRTLKSGGYFISTADVYNPIMKERYPNLLRSDGITYSESLFKIFCDSGLIPLDDGDYEVEEFYKNIDNRIISGPNSKKHTRLHPANSQNNHLPDYHAFSQIQDFPMLIARFVFTKK